jgi:hypothetical protein
MLFFYLPGLKYVKESDRAVGASGLAAANTFDGLALNVGCLDAGGR